MEKKKIYSLNIINIGIIAHDKIKFLFNHAGALIYPSITESFALPLIEARQANLAILASELNYVRDVIDPEQSFDPYSSGNITLTFLSSPALHPTNCVSNPGMKLFEPRTNG